MITKISTTTNTFNGYRQTFTDKEFQAKLDENFAMQKQAPFSAKYIQAYKNKHFGVKFLKKNKKQWQKHSFEPFVKLSIDNNMIKSQIKYINMDTIEYNTNLSENLKRFFKKTSKTGRLQMEKDKVSADLWQLIEEEKYLEACQKQRIQLLTIETYDFASSLRIYFDNKYTEITEKLTKLSFEKNIIIDKLNKINKKLSKLK